MITLILPISNEQGFENLRKSLFNLSADLDKRSNLLVVCYDKDIYLKARDYLTEYQHIGEWRVIYSEKKNLLATLDYLGSDEYIFIWNEKVLLLQGAMINLYRQYLDRTNAGFISGQIDIPVPYWIKDIYADKVQLIKSDKKQPNEWGEIDVAYPFCMMTKKDHFVNYFFTKSRSKLAFGLALRRAGFQNYLNKQSRCKYKAEVE